MISVLQSSLYVGDIASTALSMRCTEGSFRTSKNTSGGRGSPSTVDLANRSVCSFSPIGMFFIENLRKRLPFFELYQDIFLALDLLLCCFYVP
jgi:hypothetical protein